MADQIDRSGVRRHAALLPLMIDTVIKSVGVGLTQIDAVSYSKGPGSYTGLRVGLSTAKGLCLALNKPLIGISTLLALSYAIEHLKDGDHCITMIDAGRQEVYHGVYNHNHLLMSGESPFIINQENWDHHFGQFNSSIYLCGDGINKVKDLRIHNQNTVFVTEEVLARYMVKPALKKFLTLDFENLAYAVPEYLKAPSYKKIS